MESSWRFLTSSVMHTCAQSRPVVDHQTFAGAGCAFLQAVKVIEVGSTRRVTLVHETAQMLPLFIDLVGLGPSGAPVMKAAW